jgi:streptomycin 3"-adenylyltransferase
LQKYSDIDLFAVVDRPSTREEKARIAQAMLSISGVYMKSEKRSIELTVVVRSEVNPWRYPPRFDFQYGDWLRRKFESGVYEPWNSHEMPDLAVVVTQVMLASQTVYGPAPDLLLDAVPYRDFITATVKEIDSLMADFEGDTRNVLLTLARMWCTLETDAIWSKPGAAEWAAYRLPQRLQPVIWRARAICIGEETERWDDLQVEASRCAGWMVGKIKAIASSLEAVEVGQRRIHIGC